MEQQRKPIDIEGNISHQGKVIHNTGKENINDKYKVKVAEDDSDQEESLINHKKYGNLLVIRSSSPHLSLGPHYCCFIVAFLAFSTASFFIIKLIFQTSQNPFYKIATFILCIAQPLSYLIVALSNPGVIIKPQKRGSDDSKSCFKCMMQVPQHARHCDDCNLCVAEWDHHCPWVSKCIGGNNIIRFYIFLGITPVYFIFTMVSFLVCASTTKVYQLSRSG